MIEDATGNINSIWTFIARCDKCGSACYSHIKGQAKNIMELENKGWKVGEQGEAICPVCLGNNK